MPGTIRPRKDTVLARVLALIAGFQKHFPAGSFTIDNVAYTTATLTPRLQPLADAIQQLNAAQALVSTLVNALHETMADVSPDVLACERFVRAHFGAAPGPLADFGLAPPKTRTPLTGEQRLLASARAAATRRARGTKSRKQRLAIKGDVTGVVVTPITSPDPIPSK